MGGGLPGGGIALGGGGLGAAGIVIYLLFALLNGGGGLSGPLSNLDNQTANGQQPGQVLGQECQTGADTNKEDCRIVADVNSIQKYWTGELRQEGKQYSESPTVFFSGATDTGCGQATSDVGPFYCPPDKTVYIDLGFFDELSSRFGAQGGPFAEAYVLAHEYGHHVQDQFRGSSTGSATTARARRARRCAPSSRPTATRASGRTTPCRPATSPT